MKKLAVLALCATMMFSVTACGDTNDNNGSSVQESSVESTQTSSQESSEAVDDNQGGAQEDNQGSVNNGQTMSNQLADVFEAQVTANPSASAMDIVAAFDGLTDFGQASMEVEPGLLNGFDNTEITGFTQGAMMGPMIGSIPFISYVFVLPEDADAQAFADNLKATGNRRWNICTEADETVTRVVNNYVFFAMGPNE